MDEPSRFRFVSPTFLVGFGFGTFVGVALAVAAFALAEDSPATPPANLVFVSPSPQATSTPEPTPVERIVTRTTATQNVRLGPGEGFAIIGIISSGDAVEIVGRDDATEWVAFRFPPGSTGLGWLPVSGIDSASGLSSFAVVLPTPLSRSLSTPTPSVGDESGSGSGSGSLDQGDLDPTVTPTPSGPPDLTVTNVTVLADGRLQVTIINLGPGSLNGFSIPVLVSSISGASEGWRSSTSGLAAGESAVFETITFLVTERTTVLISIDPGFSLDDGDRSNNSREFSVAPPVQPTPTATPRPRLPPTT